MAHLDSFSFSLLLIHSAEVFRGILFYFIKKIFFSWRCFMDRVSC